VAQHLAIKLYKPGKLRLLWSLVDLSQGLLAAKHTVTIERVVLQLLGWRVHPTTLLAFCQDLICLMSGDVEPGAGGLHNATKLVRFTTELSVCAAATDLVTRRPFKSHPCLDHERHQARNPACQSKQKG